jgi:hypothetical protein
VHLVVMLVAFGGVAVNAFGAWAVSRRRPMVARLFLLAAMVLTVAGVAYAYRSPGAWWILLSGAVLAFGASFLHARLVLGKVVWANHVARGLAFAAALVLAWRLVP